MRATLTALRRRHLAAAVLVAAILVVGAASVDAQIVEVPPFVAIDANFDVHFGSYTYAAGADSSVLVLMSRWTNDINKSHKFVQRFAPSGTPLGGLIQVDEADHDPFIPSLMADGRGGFYAIWRLSGVGNLPLAARPLGPTGTPTGSDVVFTPRAAFSGGGGAALPTGAVFVWNDYTEIRGVLVDEALQPRAPSFTVATFPSTTVFDSAVTAKADGGFVVTWKEAGKLRGRIFDASASPLGPAIDLGNDFEPGAIVGSPLSGFVIVGSRVVDTHRLPAGVWGRRYDDAGAPAGPAFVIERTNPHPYVLPVADFDPAGRLYVAWTLATFGRSPRARVYDASGAPLQSSFAITDDGVTGLQIAPRPDGRIVETWFGQFGDLVMQVRALCVPPEHTGCGNGVLEAPCERCDAGAANDDTTPDACRTNCMPASCGDGVVDTGEQCDDGNLVGCDGCDADCHLETGYVCGDGIVSAACEEECDDGPGNDDTLPNACRTSCKRAHCNDGVLDDGEACDDGNATSCDGCSDHCVAEPGLVCGDGIPEVLCGEQCDDGNDVVGDGCSGPCRLERIFGGGSPHTDCVAEWVVDNPTNVPIQDQKRGGFNGSQVCQDGDPRCDFGGVAGSCTFHVRVCGNNTDAPSCRPADKQRLRSWALRVPSESKAAKRPDLALVRAAFATVPGAIIGPALPDVCSDTLDVVVPVEATAIGAKAGTLILKSYATLYTGEKDTDKLKLVCRP